MSRRRFGFAWGVIVVLAVELATAVGVSVIAGRRDRLAESTRADNRVLVRQLDLGDLALWSGASYCRHPALADFFTAHADHPSALDHFPAGSMVPPPRPWPLADPEHAVGDVP